MTGKNQDRQDPMRRGTRAGWGRGMRRLGADLTPLRTSRDFRLVFTSRTITLFGSQATEVALLVQARQLTGSALAVGLLGAAELVPLVVFGLYGGALADRVDRRRLIRYCEAGLGGCAALLVANASLTHPAVWPLYVVAASMMALAALQRPSLDASVPRVVGSDQLTAASALLGLSSNASFIAGSALGGVLAAAPGPQAVYLLDAASFAVSLGFLGWLGPLPAPAAASDASGGDARGGDAPGGDAPGGDAPAAPARGRGGLRDLLAGVRYACGRPELLGSYLVDLSAMTLAYPNALFPFLAAELHAPWAAGLMFAAPSAGAACASAMSGWAGRVRRHGRAIALAAAAWGLAITGLGFAPDLAAALAFLVLAGGADMMSGVFRDTLWNQTIPDRLRGRLAGVELLSYGLGPSAGQIRAGGVASITTPRFSLWSGGLLCVAAIGVTCAALPGLLRYRAAPPGAAGPPSVPDSPGATA
jgi:MFS family permease